MAKIIQVGDGSGREYSEDEVLQKCNDMVEKYGNSGSMGKWAGQAMFFARYCKQAIESKHRLQERLVTLQENVNLLSELLSERKIR